METINFILQGYYLQDDSVLIKKKDDVTKVIIICSTILR